MKIYFSFLIFINILLITVQKVPQNVTPIEASVYYIKTTGKYKVVEGKMDKMAAAYATYTPSYEEKGWDFLTLSSYDGVDDKITNIIITVGKCLILLMNFSKKIYYLCRI